MQCVLEEILVHVGSFDTIDNVMTKIQDKYYVSHLACAYLQYSP